MALIEWRWRSENEYISRSNKTDIECNTSIEVKNCTMEFPGVKALDNVNFTLMPGECHALVGENGAGKTTLSKCITGEYRMTQGELYIEGKRIRNSNYTIRESQSLGISIVHQEFQLMNEMTGLENVFLGRYETKSGFIDWKALQKKIEELKDFLEVDVNFNIPVKYLRTAEKQIVQLARALVNDSKVIIFDELTAVLQEKDIQNIFRIINVLKKRGIGIIYISHRLDEVFECCDSYTVLCDGKHINSGKVADIDKPQLIRMIIGRELTQAYPQINNKIGDTLLEIRDFTAPKAFRDVNLCLREGEVIGIAGLVGAGKTELVQAIFGNHELIKGKILLRGKEVKIKNPRHAIKLGIGFVPDERRMLGLNMLFDIKDNTTLPTMAMFRKYKIFQDKSGSQGCIR